MADASDPGNVLISKKPPSLESNENWPQMPPDLDGRPALGLIANPASPLPACGEPQWAETLA